MDKDKHAVMLRRRGYAYDEIAKELSVSIPAVGRMLAAGGEVHLHPKVAARNERIDYLYGLGKRPREIAKATGIPIAKVYTRTQQLCAMRMEPGELLVENDRQAIYDRYPKGGRFLVVSDMHNPLAYMPALEDALQAKGPFTAGLRTGDTWDFYALSRFRKENIVPIATEVSANDENNRRLLRKVPEIIDLQTNHEGRLDAQVLDAVENAAKALGAHARPLYEALVKIKKNFFERNTGVKSHGSWWMRVGNVILAHPERYSKVRLASAQATLDYFWERGEKNINALFVGHLHRMTQPTLVKGVWLCEMPAMCKRMGYMNKAKAYGGPLHVGHTILVIDKEGNMVPNETRCHFTAAL